MSRNWLNQIKISRKLRSPLIKRDKLEKINSIDLNPSIWKPIFKESNWIKPEIIRKT